MTVNMEDVLSLCGQLMGLWYAVCNYFITTLQSHVLYIKVGFITYYLRSVLQWNSNCKLN